MKALGCCLLVAFAIVHAAVDVEKTVRQVQNILRQNRNLPRLSRDEILQLLNDIRAEDAKSASKERYTTQNPTTSSMKTELKSTEYNDYEQPIDNEIPENDQINYPKIKQPDEESNFEQEENSTERQNKTSDPSVMVVLPYTPRDGASLQELYTKPPRFEVLKESQIVPEKKVAKLQTDVKIKEVFKTNAEIASKAKTIEMPPDLQHFLDSHGLSGEPGKDHYLLPLDGFKPLPTPQIVDGNVQLPENILLTYELIKPEENNKSEVDTKSNDDLFEPLKPEFPYDLENASTDEQTFVLPLDLPKSRKPKSTPAPNYDPIDYDSVKVIPLRQGPKPEESDEKTLIENDQNKRQAQNETSEKIADDTTTVAPEVVKEKSPGETPAADSTGIDMGASITDLEDSFGGAAPSEPGDSMLPPKKKNGFYWMLDWNSFLEVGDGDSKVNIRLEPKLGDPQMFLPVTVP